MGCCFGFVVERYYFFETGGKEILPTILFVGESVFGFNGEFGDRHEF